MSSSAELTAISGISPWTVQGAMLVALRREDVVLPGDLALRKAVQATVEQGGEATMRLITDPALDAVTGQFFDGLRTSRALPQAYDRQFRKQLREVTDRMFSQAT